MKRYKTTITSIAAGALSTVLLGATMSPVDVRAQNEQYPPQRQERNTTSPTDESTVRTFTGRITKNGDQYVLEDSNTSYVLDNQK